MQFGSGLRSSCRCTRTWLRTKSSFSTCCRTTLRDSGRSKTDDLYELPFTTLHTDSLDVLFEELLADGQDSSIGTHKSNKMRVDFCIFFNSRRFRVCLI